jgi:adenylate cyclase
LSVRSDPVSSVIDWLTEQTIRDSALEVLVEGVCKRLWAAGTPVWRFFGSFPTLHPLYLAIGVVWQRGEPIQSATFEHGRSALPEFLDSPVHFLTQNGLDFLRRRLEGQSPRLDFPILRELKEQGATDYVIFHLAFPSAHIARERTDGLYVSFATDAAGGFGEDDLRVLGQVFRTLAVACKMAIASGVTRNVLSAYLGPGAAERVLAGGIKRGDCTAIHAAIWYSDLRDSTPLASRLSPQDFLHALNGYFECTAAAVVAQGGEVLRFVGDAVLGIFPVSASGGGEADACRRAVEAVRDAERRMAALNDRRATDSAAPLAYGVGLHLGEVLFGNIGIPERLEFSVIGPAANEVARLESLTKDLGVRALFSGEFVPHLDLRWRSLGRHALRGVGREMEVFALPE